MDLIFRPRRLRYNPLIRDLVRETRLNINDFIYPIFVIEGNDKKEEISSMPGIYRLSPDLVLKEIQRVNCLGIKSILLFGIPDKKDDIASGAYDENGIIQKTTRIIKSIIPDVLLITDVCNCEYTIHGHCGILKNGDVDNDETIELLVKTSLSYAKAGADIIAPSDMMDGRIKAIRLALDKNNFSHIPIMSYAVKYCSSFYGPFREAANSAPKFGNRKTYQMDPSNSREALFEVKLDLQEGADIIMIKPALAYLDIIKQVKSICDRPVAAYNVSGEYSMIKAASSLGWINEKDTIIEVLTAIKRAGADIIITYFAPLIAEWLNN